jgi:hypothetical protein
MTRSAESSPRRVRRGDLWRGGGVVLVLLLALVLERLGENIQHRTSNIQRRSRNRRATLELRLAALRREWSREDALFAATL